MLLLAFDTATPAVTVALHDGTHVLAETTTVDARRHGELLASSIDAVLAEAGAGRLDITAVAAGTGPGPYTGLRAGLVTARVFGSALGVPVYGVCTLDVIAADAAAAAGGREFIVATDARRREVYWARYDATGRRLDGPAVGFPADVAEVTAAHDRDTQDAEDTARAPRTARAPTASWPPERARCSIPVSWARLSGRPTRPPAPWPASRPPARRGYSGPRGRADLPAPARRPGPRPAEAGDGTVTRHDAVPPVPATPDPSRAATTTTPPRPPGFALRAMTRADLPAVLRLEDDLFGDEAWSEAMLVSELDGAEASGRYYLVAEDTQPAGNGSHARPAEDSGQLVGYAGLLSPGGGQADVLTMAVARDRWGQRVGARLLDALVAEAARRGCTDVFLEVRVDNDRAQRLYRSRGFAEIGIRRGYYQPSGTDALVMQLSLPRPRRFGFSGTRRSGTKHGTPSRREEVPGDGPPCPLGPGHRDVL